VTAGSITQPGGPLVIISSYIQFGFKHQEFFLVIDQLNAQILVL